MSAQKIEFRPAPCRAVTRGPQHHFFGYYDKCPWNATGRLMLAMEVPFMDRMPEPEDALTIGLIDLRNESVFTPLDRTYAWSWQQGCMLQWLPDAPDRKILYNAREDGRFVCKIRDILSGEVRTLPRPVYTVSPDGRWGLSLNFARLDRTRPGYGYNGTIDGTRGELAPAADGMWRVDLHSGESELLWSLERAASFQARGDFQGAEHWFNHPYIAPDSERFFFLHRWRNPKGGPITIGGKPMSWGTRAYTLSRDGSDPFVLSDDDMFSHFDWLDAEHLLAWARRHEHGDHYYLFKDRTPGADLVGADVLTRDGHCTYSPDRKWMLTDQYPDSKRERPLILFRLRDGQRFDVGSFYTPPVCDGPIRCDLHPRWNRDGTQVCIDSPHEGTRQMYVLDVSDLVATG
ncbi:MAG: hypothetical protein HS116_18900 [Planctomycetes bacterium]|nr:hypothetical protein [Planctomycetota bacterium]